MSTNLHVLRPVPKVVNDSFIRRAKTPAMLAGEIITYILIAGLVGLFCAGMIHLRHEATAREICAAETK